MSADKAKDAQREEDALAREIDRLLKKLPHADPMLKGDQQPVVQAQHRTPAVQAAQQRAQAQAAAAPSPRAQRIGVWARTVLGAGLGAAVLGWPYANACGFGLFAYLFAVTAVIVAGGWAAVWSWRVRVPVAHVIAMALMFWGIALGAGMVLPRIGYAAQAATWMCPPGP